MSGNKRAQRSDTPMASPMASPSPDAFTSTARDARPAASDDLTRVGRAPGLHRDQREAPMWALGGGR